MTEGWDDDDRPYGEAPRGGPGPGTPRWGQSGWGQSGWGQSGWRQPRWGQQRQGPDQPPYGMPPQGQPPYAPYPPRALPQYGGAGYYPPPRRPSPARIAAIVAVVAALLAGLGWYAVQQLHRWRPPGGAVSVPMAVTRDGDVWGIVDVRINGTGPYHLVVDSGATSSLLSASAATAAGLARHGQRSVTTVGCDAMESQADLKTWSVTESDGTAVGLPPVSALVAGGSLFGGDIDGLLGADVLDAFGVATLDYGGGSLRLATAPPPGDGGKRIDLEVDRAGSSVVGIVQVQLTASAKPHDFIVDTGAGSSAVDESFVQQAGLPEGSGHQVGGVSCTTTAHAVALSQWSVEGVQLPTTTVAAIEGMVPKDTGLLGSDVFSTFGRVTLDFDDSVLILG